MKTTKLLYLIPAALSLSLAGASANTAASPPIGFNKVTMQPGSDAVISAPFHQKPAFTGKVSTATHTGGGAIVAGEDIIITTEANVDWSGQDFSDLYYVRFTSGPKEGFFYTVIGNTQPANGQGSLTLDVCGDDCSAVGVAADNTFSLIPHWTISLLFPEVDGPPVAPTSLDPWEGFADPNFSQILIPDTLGDGINKAPNLTLVHFEGDWKVFTDLFGPSQDNFVILPHSHFIVRNDQANPAEVDLEICISGRVPTGKHVLQVDGLVAGQHDTYVSHDRPIPVTLDELGEGMIGTAFAASNLFSATGLQDQILVWDNSQAGINKSPTKTYIYQEANVGPPAVTEGWALFSNPFEVKGSDTLEPGEVFIIRRAAGSAESEFIVNNPNY